MDFVSGLINNRLYMEKFGGIDLENEIVEGSCDGEKIYERAEKQVRLLSEAMSLLDNVELVRIATTVESAEIYRQEILNLIRTALGNPSPENMERLHQASYSTLHLLKIYSTGWMSESELKQNASIVRTIYETCWRIGAKILDAYDLSVGS